jgi:hypothetical protein
MSPDSKPVIMSGNPGAKPQTWLQDNVAPLLALVTVAGGLYIMGFGENDKAAIIAPLVTLVLGYWFGTGAGSQAKDKVIAALKGNGK